jgi:hypothetical protein
MAAKLPKVKKPAISAPDAHAILSWVFGSVSVNAKQLTDEDRCFAQAMLMEMLDASFAMGFVEALFKAAAKLPSGPKKVIVTFLKGAGKNLVKYKDKDDLKKMMDDPQIYKSVLVTLGRNFKSVWKIREQAGELIY